MEKTDTAWIDEAETIPECVCQGTGHVCENHPSKVWGGIHPDGCDCGAGMPCPYCCRPVPQDGTHSIAEAFIPSAVLRRLVEEVRVENNDPARYNRIHNRHNRGR